MQQGMLYLIFQGEDHAWIYGDGRKLYEPGELIWDEVMYIGTEKDEDGRPWKHIRYCPGMMKA